MPAKWQQWMPLHIDRFLGSTDVQMMEPPAFKGYLCLLLAAWQTDDCALPSDDNELARHSRLGRKLWLKHKGEVLRKFATVTDAVTVRLRNEVEFELWTDAKRVFEARSASAFGTNRKRSPRRSPRRSPSTVTDTPTVEQNTTVTDTVTALDFTPSSPSFPPHPLSNPTIPGTGTETSTGTGDNAPERSPSGDWDAEPAENIPDGLSSIQYAVFVLQECAIPGGYALKVKTGDAIEMLAREEQCTMAEATKRMLDRMRDAAKTGGVKWLFWLEDGGWKQAAGDADYQRRTDEWLAREA